MPSRVAPFMKIAVIGHIRHPIAPPFMGGMEAHCHQLVQALSDRGHRVTLFAAAGSDAPDLVAIGAPYERVLPWSEWRGTDRLVAFQADAFARAIDGITRGAYDVVHNNSLSPEVIDWGRSATVPMVTSQHVPPFATMRGAVARAKDVAGSAFTVTSRQQLSLWGEDAGANMHVVPNGIDLACWHGGTARSDYLVWYGRIAQTKGLREAVAAARLAGARLRIVGTIEDAPYFEAHVRPFLDDRIRYDGHLQGSALRRVVAGARAAVVTPMWDEPFGLVAAEAMAAAVPVIAFDRGAMREVLGDCGRLVPAGDVDALASAMRRADELDGSACRRRVERLYSLRRMIEGYEAIYRAAMSGPLAQPRSSAIAPAALASSQSRTRALLP